jgi:uncharacterized protein (DUF1697 family)
VARYVALLRAVNVGGTGKLPMARLKAIAEALGWRGVRTYIASGNLIFEADEDRQTAAARLAAALEVEMERPVGLVIRTPSELAAAVAVNPFAEAEARRVVVCFLDRSPPREALASFTGRRQEEIALGEREVFIHYPEGMAESRLSGPLLREGTGRNINTVAKLIALGEEKTEK